MHCFYSINHDIGGTHYTHTFVGNKFGKFHIKKIRHKNNQILYGPHLIFIDVKYSYNYGNFGA